MARLCLLVALLFILCVPVPTHALTPIVQCGFPIPCTACDFFQLSANLMRWLVALVTLVITLVVVYSGVLIITSQGNAAQLEKAKSMLKNAFIGFIILLCAWLIIDTLMKTFLDQGKIGRPWNTITADACKTEKATAPTPVGGGTGTSTATSTPPGGSVPSGDIQARICTAANAFIGTVTSNVPGTDNGRRACAWAVNSVVKNAGLKTLDALSVHSTESSLKGGRGQSITKGNATCGDVVIVTGAAGNHIGICLSTGCTQVISNASSKGTFSWRSSWTNQNNPFEYNGGPYNGYSARVYRVVN